jgi:hypothetical protein
VPQDSRLTRTGLRTPKAAAFAGIVFSILLTLILWLFRISVPADPLEPGAWLASGSGTVALAINLVAFAGVAFLWFIGVLRERIGTMEDRFFATIFLGSGLIFLAMLFVASAVVGAIMLAFSADPARMANSGAYYFARAFAYNLVNVYAIKMAGVFMLSTSIVLLHTGLVPRRTAYLGFVLAAFVIFGSQYFNWSIIVLPAWALGVSIHILIAARQQQTPSQSPAPLIADHRKT